MTRIRLLLPLALLVCGTVAPRGSCQAAPHDELRMVIVLSRHGVRTPIESETRKSRYNAQPWPAWPVPPGVLTPHGTTLMQRLGAYYRLHYDSLFPGAATCPAIYAYADQQQRDIASTDALLAGLAPGCSTPVNTIRGIHAEALPEDGARRSAIDPLFSADAFSDVADRPQLAAAISGQLGGDPERLSLAYQPQLAELQAILSGAHPGPGLDTLAGERSSITPGNGDNLLTIHSPMALAADFAENFLLQYAEGLSQVGWGRVSRPTLDRLMAVNTAYHNLILQTPDFARLGASDMASHIDATLRQAIAGKPVKGAFGAPGTRLVLLLGHDSNLTWMSGLLHLHWMLSEGALDAAPPGSAIVFELHRDTVTGEFSVRTLFVSQTLDQMRQATALTDTPHDPGHPGVAAIFVPGCSTEDDGYPCPAEAFHQAVQSAIDPRFVR